MKTQNITIVGLRRTGRSVAMAIKAGPLDFTLIGHDSSSDLNKQALASGVIDKAESNLIRAAAAADILVLAMPSVELEDTLRTVGEDLQEHTLVIDLTALKGPGIKWAERYLKKGHYIGARPVLSAGTFTGGLEDADKARADLFANSVFCLMPGVETDPQAVETAINFGRLLGSVPYFVDPLEYDSLAQGVESMPGLVAAAVFASINKTTGWRDILRFAGLPFATVTMPLETESAELAHLALNDKLATLRWIDALMAEIDALRRVIYAGNPEVLTAVLDETSLSRARWLQERGKNEWLEITDPPVDMPGMGQRFLGNLANLGDKR